MFLNWQCDTCTNFTEMVNWVLPQVHPVVDCLAQLRNSNSRYGLPQQPLQFQLIVAATKEGSLPVPNKSLLTSWNNLAWNPVWANDYWLIWRAVRSSFHRKEANPPPRPIFRFSASVILYQDHPSLNQDYKVSVCYHRQMPIRRNPSLSLCRFQPIWRLLFVAVNTRSRPSFKSIGRLSTCRLVLYHNSHSDQRQFTFHPAPKRLKSSTIRRPSRWTQTTRYHLDVNDALHPNFHSSPRNDTPIANLMKIYHLGAVTGQENRLANRQPAPQQLTAIVTSPSQDRGQQLLLIITILLLLLATLKMSIPCGGRGR